jgi:hypothetical protein
LFIEGKITIFLFSSYLSGLFNMISAAITPGTQPHNQRMKTIRIEPQPLSITAKGGHKIERSTLQKLIIKNYSYKLILIHK